MRFIRRKSPEPDRQPSSQSQDEQQLRETVTRMVERRRVRGTGFNVLSLAPQLFPGERALPSESAIVREVLDQQLRRDDRYCPFEDGYLIVLPHTADDQAKIVAHRLAAEVTLAVASVTGRKWSVGLAAYPRDAKTESALIELARASARGHPPGR